MCQSLSPRSTVPGVSNSLSDTVVTLTGLVPSSSTIEGLCTLLSGNDLVTREASSTNLLQEVIQGNPAICGPRVWVIGELGRGVLRVGHRGSQMKRVELSARRATSNDLC